MPTKRSAQIDALLENIAQQHLNIYTLEANNSDSDDFHDCAVWAIKSALEEAYRAGMAAAKIKTGDHHDI